MPWTIKDLSSFLLVKKKTPALIRIPALQVKISCQTLLLSLDFFTEKNFLSL
jgi:hypothetical protein